MDLRSTGDVLQGQKFKPWNWEGGAIGGRPRKTKIPRERKEKPQSLFKVFTTEPEMTKICAGKLSLYKTPLNTE